MQALFPLLFASLVGFGHAFEIDHLLAMGSMVTRRKTAVLAIKDGMYWGLGHTSTMLLIGGLMILAQVAVSAATFHYFEASVGVMLLALGLQRIRNTWRYEQKPEHAHTHNQSPSHPSAGHRLAYSVGLVHGLAGSGALVLLVMTQLKTTWDGIFYLLIFGLGSVLGMMCASSVFFLPFSRKLSGYTNLHRSLVLLSALLCIGFGCKVIFENINAL